MSKIMILEDDPASQLLMKEILRKRQYEVCVYADGLAALDAMEKTCPDLVIVDVMLPTINGYQFCERLHQDPRYTNIPVIILTALNEDQHRIRAMEAGALDFLCKPFNRVELLTKIETLINYRKAANDMLSVDTFAEMISAIFKLRFPNLMQNTIRVRQYAERICSAYGIPQVQIKKLYYAILFRDIAYLTLKEPTLPSSFDDNHAELSASLLSGILKEDVIHLIRYHHTPLNSLDYPEFLSADQKQLLRILSVCSRYDYCVNVLYADNRSEAKARLLEDAASGMLSKPELELLLQLEAI